MILSDGRSERTLVPDGEAPTLRLGPYHVIEKIAGGGMAEIYKVYHEARPGDVLALKMVRADKSHDLEFRKMLIDEAKIGARLKHPNIARVLGFHESEGRAGLILEFVDGIDLVRAQALLRERRARFPLDVAVHLLSELLLGLDFAHRVNDETGEPLQLVHRDISPGNIMVDVRGMVRIVDWGIARAKNRIAATDAGQVKGKFRYMAPEQITGNHAGPHTDVYAAAVSFWEILAGHRVYDDLDVPQLMLKVSRGELPALSAARADIPRELDTVFQEATHRDPDRRFPSAAEFLDALLAVPIQVDPISCRERLAQLPTAARYLDRRKGYERAVHQAKTAATTGDLENAVLRALEEPDRVERVEVDWEALSDGEGLRRSQVSG